MKKHVGLWVDHRSAVIVTITEEGEKMTQVRSKADKHARFAGGNRKDGQQQAETIQDRQFGNDLNHYYDEIIALIHDAESIQIFGPGEAKMELEKRIENKGIKAHLPAVESVDRMTDGQIAAKVRTYYST